MKQLCAMAKEKTFSGSGRLAFCGGGGFGRCGLLAWRLVRQLIELQRRPVADRNPRRRGKPDPSLGRDRVVINLHRLFERRVGEIVSDRHLPRVRRCGRGWCRVDGYPYDVIRRQAQVLPIEQPIGKFHFSGKVDWGRVFEFSSGAIEIQCACYWQRPRLASPCGGSRDCSRRFLPVTR